MVVVVVVVVDVDVDADVDVDVDVDVVDVVVDVAVAVAVAVVLVVVLGHREPPLCCLVRLPQQCWCFIMRWSPQAVASTCCCLRTLPLGHMTVVVVRALFWLQPQSIVDDDGQCCQS